jgi:hypothetical protein
MADDPPISTTVPETVTVDTGADKESLGNLNEHFADFWKSEDEKVEAAPAAPEAPGEGAGQETAKAPAETKPDLGETKAPVPETKPPSKEITDEEIDKMETPPHWRPEVIERIKNLKDLWKGDRARARAEAERAAKLQADLEEARKNSWTPEARADYEHAASIRRKYDFVSDPEFIQKFQAPIVNQYKNVLEEAIGVLPDRAAAQAWAEHIFQNYKPDQLDRNWWLNSVIAKVPNELDRASLLQNVTELLKSQRDRDNEITRRTNDKSSFDNYVAEKVQNTTARVQEEIMAEIGVQEKRIQEVLPRDINQAKTTEERRAIEEHNERFTRLNTFFQDSMKDLSLHGPRAWVRISVEATRAKLLDEEIKAVTEEAKSLRAERDQYKAELDKISGARRRISHTSGTPPSTGKDKSNGGLSLSNLDVRKAFESFNWEDGSK